MVAPTLTADAAALRAERARRGAAAARRFSQALPAAVRETLQLFWESPFPATLQDAAFRLVDVNDAFVVFSGFAREQVVGRDPVELQPAEDRATSLVNRRRLQASRGRADRAALSDGRIIDARGCERWYRAARSVLEGQGGAPLYLAVLQDTTPEHAARESADRSVRELDDWFDLSPAGMVLFDESGLLVRTNPAFDALAGSVPISLAEGAPGLARLLAWDEGAPQATLRPGAPPVETEGWVEQPGGATRRLRAIVRCYRTAAGERRYMGIVEDRSVEEERDLARLQIGALMDTAGVGIATFQESSGWVRQQPVVSGGAAVAASSLHNISRDIVAPESLAEYERLQVALRRKHRAEVRYAIQHPELGQRWLLTRVEPATLASGKMTTSVVTLDITDQRQSQRRSEQQRVELETMGREAALQAGRTRAILDSVLVGIVTVGANGIEWMNRSARRMFAGELADFVDQPMSTVATVEPDHPFRRTRYLEDLVEGQAETFECRVRGRDGREFWVVGNAVATGRHGSGRQLTYALLDIERRRQAEAAAGVAQASLRRVIDAAPLAIALLDAGTLAVVQVNEVAARTVHGDAEQLIGKSPEDILPPQVAAARRLDMTLALASSTVTSREYRFDVAGQEQVWDARYLPLASAAGAAPDQLLLVATDVTEQRAAQEARLEAALAQRDMLVKEVHHRIKNNLQGVAGLLQQIAERKPEVAAAIDEVVGQVQAIAEVYGLQVGAIGPLSVVRVLEAITASVQRTFGRPIRCNVVGASAAEWSLPEAEAIPIALTLNELLTNAVKHGVPMHADEAIACTLTCSEDGVTVAISSRARLPGGFNLARVPNGVSGLGLVRALLPKRSARLAVEQAGADVVATVELNPPGVARLAAA